MINLISSAAFVRRLFASSTAFAANGTMTPTA